MLAQPTARSAAGRLWFAYAAAAGVAAGAAAQVLRQDVGVLAYLGGGTAFWLTIGFLVARHAARGRPLSDGSVWAWAALAMYLMAWLTAYCAVFGFHESAGLGAAFVHERPFFVAMPIAGLVIGIIAADVLETRLARRCLYCCATCLVAPRGIPEFHQRLAVFPCGRSSHPCDRRGADCE